MVTSKQRCCHSLFIFCGRALSLMFGAADDCEATTGVSRPGQWRQRHPLPPCTFSLRGPQLGEVSECDTTHTHTRHTPWLHVTQAAELVPTRKKSVWNPVKLQGFIDSLTQTHVKEERSDSNTNFLPSSSKNSRLVGFCSVDGANSIHRHRKSDGDHF